jgi:APA family basic amino acid/polyamine antiporter
MDAAIADLSVSEILSRVALLSLWGFIGIESATASADSVKNPARTIPLAIIMGTLCTALLYLLNSFSIMSVLSGNELANSAAPYTTVIKYILGGQWHLIIAVIASVICISSLNVWILISGQIALGLAQDGLLPAWFGKKNSYNAPVWALCLSCLGIFQLLIFSAQKNVSQQIEMLIGYSVTPFLFIYAFSCLAFFKLLLKGTKPLNIKLIHLMYGIPAFVFCCWVITKTSTENITAAAFFAISGLPFYFYYVAKNSK